MSKYIPNSFQTPNTMVDDLMHLLDGNEYKILSFTVRHIYGWQDKIQRGKANISLTMYEKGFGAMHGVGLSRPTIVSVLDELVKYRVILKVGKATKKGQAYSIGTEPDIEGLTARQDAKYNKDKKRLAKVKESSKDTSPVKPLNHNQLNDLTGSGKATLPNKTQDKTQDKTLTPATTDVARTEEQTPKNPAFKRTKELTETVLQVISEPVFGIQYETLKDRKNNFVAYNMVNAFVDAYNTLGLNPSIQEVEQDIKNYHTYYMRKHKRITLPRQRDKVGLYFLEYMQQKTTSYQPQAQIGNKETELDKQMKALIKAEAV